MEKPILRFHLRPPHTTQKTGGGGAGGQAGAASYRQPDSPACHPRWRRRLWLGGGLIWLRARQGPREPFIQLSLRQLRSSAETHTSLYSFQTWLEERRKSCCVLRQLINVIIAAGLLELSGNDANNGRPPASRTQRTQARCSGSAR